MRKWKQYIYIENIYFNFIINIHKPLTCNKSENPFPYWKDGIKFLNIKLQEKLTDFILMKLGMVIPDNK